jgi:hypothetical protein
MPETQSLYAKLAEVTKEIGRVEKAGHNDFHNYDYVKEDDLVEAVRGKLADRNVALLSSALEVTKVGTLTTAHLRFTFVDGGSGETHDADWFGTGDDKGDKGLYKAYTGALKYFLMKTFLIPTGNDPDQDAKGDERANKRRTKTQNGKVNPKAKELRERIANLGIDKSKVRMKLNTFDVERLEDLTDEQTTEFETWLSEEADTLA